MDKISKYATIIYAMLFFVGYLSNYVYYSLFNIDINSYFETNEILFSFLNSVTGNIVILTMGCFIIIILIPYTYIIRVYINQTQKKVRRITNYHKLFFVSILITFILFIGIIFIPINIENEKLFGIYNDTLTYKGIIIVILLLTHTSFLFSGLSVVILSGKRNFIVINKVNNTLRNLRITESADSLKKTVKASIVLMAVVLLYFLISLFQFNRANKALYDSNKQIMFLYNNELIETNDSIKYIGDTKNYIFIYNLNMQEVKVFERDNISSYKIRKK